jgi:hypothetical protein
VPLLAAKARKRFQLTGFAVRARYADGSCNHGGISIQDVSSRVNAAVGRETEVVQAQLARNGIDIYQKVV